MNTKISATEHIGPAAVNAQKRGCLFYVKRGLLALGVLIVALPMLGFVYQQSAEASDRQAYPPPGQMIDIGGYSLHIYCVGEGSPAVILDAGGGLTSSSWGWVQPELAQTSRVCVYDRAGWGWSDPSPVGYSALQNAAELHLLLNNARISTPVILAGHSLGGLYARVYAQQYPDEVAGLVQIDASHPDAWRRTGIREGVGADPQLLAIGPLAARVGLLRLMDYGPPGSALSGQLPANQEQAIRAFLVSVQFAESAQQFDAAFPEILAQARSITSLGDLPLVVLTTGYQDMLTPEENSVLHEMQRELQALSSNSVYVEVDGANHVSLVHNREHAQATIDEILRMAEALRASEDPAE